MEWCRAACRRFVLGVRDRVLGGGERGQSLVEYVFILALVGLVMIIIVTVVGHQNSNMYSDITNAIGP